MKRTGWSSGWFARACAGKPPGSCARVLTFGQVYHDKGGTSLWGLHRDGGKWHLTHAPTGLLLPGSFSRCAEGMDFAEGLVAEVNCAIGRFGSLKGARGARAFRAAVNRRCTLYGFDPVRPVTDRVVYDGKGASALYPETRARGGEKARRAS